MAERDLVRIAFAKYIYELHNFNFVHDDKHPRNLIGDCKNKMIYIVDMESSLFYIRKRDEPHIVSEFFSWGLAGTEDRRPGIRIDPMVPYTEDFDDRPFPGEQELIQMAANPVKYPRYGTALNNKRPKVSSTSPKSK
ncbi:hypothetical protein AJ79_10135 [Helicocarpus griseus UAMH5409]|uniref:Protein kinase domain-containing protein n=1 Tax=Helicocarpus griseus UAMH5409 TaxID=1447875 RepID=A0A2B7WFD2_9EURO|nr:hypothetical protein AJ79_10135 [Helicocarpus griseus UAMH5409]